MTPTVYLAGPIAGTTEHEAKNWRRDVHVALDGYNMRGMSPLRCEPDTIGKRYQLTYEKELYGTAHAIFAKNRFDLARCDATLAYLPLKSFAPSVGTISEIAWAYEAGKLLVVASDNPAIFNHPIIQQQAGWIVPDLDTAVEVLGSILGSYVEGARTI